MYSQLYSLSLVELNQIFLCNQGRHSQAGMGDPGSRAWIPGWIPPDSGSTNLKMLDPESTLDLPGSPPDPGSANLKWLDPDPGIQRIRDPPWIAHPCSQEYLYSLHIYTDYNVVTIY